MKEEQAKKERQESKSEEHPAQRAWTCPTPVAAAATWQREERRGDMMTKEVVQKSKRSKTSGDDSSLVRGTVRTRGDEGIRKKRRSQSESARTFAISTFRTWRASSSRLTRRWWSQATNHRQRHGRLGRHQHEKMKYFVAVEERAITTSSAAVLSTLMARNIMKKISTEGPFPCGAVNEGMEPQMSVDDMQLFVCEVINKNVEEEYMEEINVSAKKCYEPERRDDFAWDDVNNFKLDPARVGEARKAEMEYFRKMHVFKKVPVQRCKDREDADKGQGGLTQKSKTKATPIPQSVRREVFQEVR